MITYKQIKIIALNEILNDSILRLPDHAVIPFVEDNTDYQKYLEWLAEGNTPEPADE